MNNFIPKSFEIFRSKYRFKDFFSDFQAGLTVAIVALPLAMAFAIASGVPPERGLFTAIIAGFLISLFGGSRFQIGGPTGAFVVVLLAVINKHGYDGLVIATILAGIMLILMGVLKLGRMVRFVPNPVISGFTTGIAVIIFSTQVKDIMGLSLSKLPESFIEQWHVYINNWNNTNSDTLTITLISIVFLFLLRRYIKKIPAPLIVIGVGSCIVWFFNIPIETIESKFGSVPSTLPFPELPSITLEKIKTVFPDAITIAFLGAIESLLSASVADGMSGDKHKSDIELIAQGSANIVSVLFGGISATGAIARTATNIKSGARSPLSGMLHSILLLIFMLFLAPYIIKIPLASLAAVLVVVAWDMSEIKHFMSVFKTPKTDVIVLLSTFLLTVLVDLNIAVQIGVVLSAFYFIKRMEEVTQISNIKENTVINRLLYEEGLEQDIDATENKEIPEQIEIYEIIGPFFFGTSEKLQSIFKNFLRKPDILILRMRQVLMLDASGLFALEEFLRNCNSNNVTLILSGVNKNLQLKIDKFGLLDKIGKDNICDHIDKALERANTILRK